MLVVFIVFGMPPSKCSLCSLCLKLYCLFPQVAATLPLYCQHSVPAEKGAIHKMTVTGSEALTQKLDILTKRAELNSEDLTEAQRCMCTVGCSRWSRRQSSKGSQIPPGQCADWLQEEGPKAGFAREACKEGQLGPE